MKLNLLQFIAFSFMLGWIGMEVVGSTYDERLGVSIMLASISAYLNNAHGIVWSKFKKMIKRAG